MSHQTDANTLFTAISTTKKLHITNFNHMDNSINLIISDNFKIIKDNVFCIIKNIKTRVEYLCPMTFENFTLSINFDIVKQFFTDYEGVLYIIVKNGDELINYSPIVQKINYASYFTTAHSTPSSFQWYLRVLDNGEMRFSCITKK